MPLDQATLNKIKGINKLEGLLASTVIHQADSIGLRARLLLMLLEQSSGLVLSLSNEYVDADIHRIRVTLRSVIDDIAYMFDTEINHP